MVRFILIRLHQLHQTFAHRRHCVSSDIPAPQHYVLKSAALSALGRIDEAWEYTEKALKYGAEDRHTLEHASIVLEARGDWKRLIEVTDKLSEIYEVLINGMVRAASSSRLW
jgi:tetratricopeptide (TPR) repeat protein